MMRTSNAAWKQEQRRRALLDIYTPGCSCEERLSDFFSNAFRRIPAADEDAYLRQIYAGKATPRSIYEPMYTAYYERLRQFAEAGYARRLTDAESIDEFVLMQRMKQNLSAFSALKNQSLSAELQALRGLPLKDFLEQGKKLTERYHRQYLRAELETALSAAQAAERWADIQRRAWLYPNLRYDTAGDERVRQEHVILDGAVYPVDHPFWKLNFPPNGWRCRCKAIQTDEAIKPVPGWEEYKSERGFDNNPGDSGLLFAHSHPYFDLPEERIGQITQAAETIRAVIEGARVQKRALDLYTDAALPVPGLQNPMLISAGYLKSIVISPDARRALRNDLLTVLKLLAPMLRFYSGSAQGYVFRLDIMGYAFHFTVQADTYLLTSIRSV